MINLSQLPPLSLYIHLPWCIRKCPYCDFNSHARENNVFPETQYIDALLRDLEFELADIQGRPISSIFFGGGTPSLFSASALARLMSQIEKSLNLEEDIEITLEANPGSAERQRFTAYRDAGINRLSIGVQSFDNDKLAILGRIHDGMDAGKAIRAAQQAGFENINVDLMYALPEQTVEQALDDIKRAIQEEPTHISWYQLTIEPNTVFYSQPPVLPDEESSWDMQEKGQALLDENGYRRYEVSAYARQGKQCVHNLNYWLFGDYSGLGAGAHGKISDSVSSTIKRRARHRIPGTYMERAGHETVISEERTLTSKDVVFEFMLNALRLSEGFSVNLFEARSGLDIVELADNLHEAEEKGFLQRDGELIRPTDTGMTYLNDLLQIFMEDERAEACVTN